MSENTCPFCQKANLCTAKRSACWCERENIPRSLIDLLPLNAVNSQCICVNCIKLYKQDAVAFKEQFNGQTE